MRSKPLKTSDRIFKQEYQIDKRLDIARLCPNDLSRPQQIL